MLVSRCLAVGALLACVPAFAGAELVLAPGKSVTFLDAANPAIRIVLTAPDDAALDLGALLDTSSPLSIVTGLQARKAVRLVENADGSVSIAAARVQPPEATVLDGGVLVFDAGRVTLHPESVLLARPGPADAPALPNTVGEPPLPALITSPVRPGAAALAAPLGGPASGTVRAGAAALALPGSILNTSNTISFGSSFNGSSGSITSSGAAGLNSLGGSAGAGLINGSLTSSGTVQITSPGGTTLQSGTLTTTGTVSTGGAVTAR